jgi:hypothetical protein
VWRRVLRLLVGGLVVADREERNDALSPAVKARWEKVDDRRRAAALAALLFAAPPTEEEKERRAS